MSYAATNSTNKFPLQFLLLTSLQTCHKNHLKWAVKLFAFHIFQLTSNSAKCTSMDTHPLETGYDCKARQKRMQIVINPETCMRA